MALAIPRYRCYIAQAKLRCASGAIISPGPYRSFRELSLAGSVDPDIWCPPTFVGNSGIECFNGVRGFALLVFVACDFVPTRARPVIPRLVRNCALGRGIQYAAASRLNH